MAPRPTDAVNDWETVTDWETVPTPDQMDNPANQYVGTSNNVPVYQAPPRSAGEEVWQEGVVNPARQVGAGLLGASATANRIGANIFDLGDMLAGKVGEILGTPKGGLFGDVRDYLRQSQHAQEQQAAQLAGNRQDFASQLYRGAAQGIAELPQYAVAGSVLGPAAGLAAIGAIQESDKGWPAALEGAASGALMGKALQVMGPASRPIRLTGAAAMTYAQLRLAGADHTTALAHATTMGALSASHPGGLSLVDIGKMNAAWLASKAFKSTLNPVQQSAVDYLKSENVPMRAGVQLGNRGLQAAEGVVAATPLGAPRAAQFAERNRAAFQGLGERLMERAHREAQTPESAGVATREGLDARIAEFQQEADAGYARAWEGRGNRQFNETVPIRIDKDGSIVEGEVNMPVDVREVKEMAQPLRDELDMSLSRSEQGQSKAYNALEKLLSGDDHVPAWMAERALSALKSLARTDNKTGVRDYGQGVAANLIPRLQQLIDAAVARTGPEAVQGLQQGREAHRNMMDVVSTAERLSAEPVQAFGQAIWAKDSGINFLRKLAFDAPDAMPKIGRALIQTLFDRITREGGIGKTEGTLNRWRDIGPETKKLLFPDEQLRKNLDDFFKGLDMAVERTNPSGTQLTKEATSLNPVRWLAGWLGGQVLYTPEGIRVLTEGLRTNPNSARGQLVAQMLRQMGGNQPPEDLTRLQETFGELGTRAGKATREFWESEEGTMPRAPTIAPATQPAAAGTPPKAPAAGTAGLPPETARMSPAEAEAAFQAERARLRGGGEAAPGGANTVYDRLQQAGDTARARLKESWKDPQLYSLFPADKAIDFATLMAAGATKGLKGLANTAIRDMGEWGAARIAGGYTDYPAWKQQMLADATEISDQAAQFLQKNAREVFKAARATLKDRQKETLTGQITNIEKILEYAEAGKEGTYWYKYARPALQPIFGPNTDLFLNFLAATSPRTPVAKNVERAIQSYVEYLSGQPFSTEFAAHKLNLERAAKGEPMSGMKVSAFNRNLLQDYIPTTVDTWMGQAYGLKGHITDPMYRFLDYAISQAAKKKGLQPAEMQAAIWTGIKKLEGDPRLTAAPFEEVVQEYLRQNPELNAEIRKALQSGKSAGEIRRDVLTGAKKGTLM